MDLVEQQLFNIDSAYEFESNGGFPLAELKRSLTHLDIITLEDFLLKHNPNMNQFSLNDLVSKLAINCTQYNTEHPSGDEQVSSGHIKEKISRHFTLSTEDFNKMENKDYDSIFSNKHDGIVIPQHLRKYAIYLAYDNRDIISYASKNSMKTIKRANSKRKRKLKDRYFYDNPLNRIHGFIVIEDNACHKCMPDSKNTKISIICANPFASKNGIKAVGGYLMMFYLIRAHLMDNDRAILEVTNNEASIDQEEDDDSSSDDEEEEDLYEEITALREYFDEVKDGAYEMVKSKNYKLTDGYDYWLKIKKDFDNNLYLNKDLFIYNWETDWIEKNFNPDDKSQDFEWPNGVDKEPRGPAKPLHFYNQLKRIPLLNVDVPPLKVIQVALNLGQAEAHGILEKDKYGFYDYIRIVDLMDEEADDKCCNIEISDNLNCNSYLLGEDDDDDNMSNLYEYEERKVFLQSKTKRQLCELKSCYDIKRPGNKADIINSILNFEFWGYDIYDKDVEKE